MAIVVQANGSSLSWDHPQPLGRFVADQKTFGTRLEQTNIPPYFRRLLRQLFQSGVISGCNIVGRSVRVTLCSGPEEFIKVAAASHLKLELWRGRASVTRLSAKRR